MPKPVGPLIAPAFTTLINTITPAQINAIHRQVIAWELRGTHPLCLNSMLIGVHTVVFTDADRSALFHIFGLTEPDVRKLCRTVSTDVNQDYPLVMSRKVSSDAFNLLCVWLIHLGLSIKDKKLSHQFRMDVAKYFHYKCFTSLVNHRFPHKADEATMLAVTTDLSKRFDLVVTGSWRLMIEERCENLVDLDYKKNIHAKTFETMTPDQAFVYTVTDTQTRLRDKIGTICTLYYDYHRDGRKIVSSSSTGHSSEGEKVLIEKASTIENATVSLTTDLMSVNAFVKQAMVNDIAHQRNDVSPVLLRTALTMLVQEAISQARTRTLDDTTPLADGIVRYDGMRILIREIITTSIEYALRNGISINNKAKLYLALRDRYSSSQIKDARILSVKVSVEHLVDQIGASSRPATKASLRLAIIMYVIARTLVLL